MPNLPLKPCNQSGCRALVSRGRCDIHQRPALPPHEKPRRYDDTRGNATARGYGYPWRKKRNAWIERHPNCAVCGKPGKFVDHRIPKSIGGADDESNYQTLCTLCNNQKTGRERRRGILS